MADKEDHAYKRSPYRARPGQNRIYQHLGVRDLREIIDRKRSERGHVTEPGIPPPDSSSNYLKDPLRENAEHNTREPDTPNSAQKHYTNKNHSHKKDREQQGGHSSIQPKNRDIKNPLNIKVEFSTSTGEHVYKLDESTVLPTIKHVPDRVPVQNRPFRGRGRGRGRSRGGQRSYQTRTIRNNKKPNELAQENEGTTQLLVTTENWDEELHESKNEEQDVNEGEEVGEGQEVFIQGNDEKERKEEEGLEKEVERLRIADNTESLQENMKEMKKN